MSPLYNEPFRRKTPEEILKEISALQRGRLKIYIGAGSGTGKTYQMLSDGQELCTTGLRVAVSAVHFGGNPATKEQVGSLQVIPTCMTDVTEAQQGDLDVDAILAYAPDVLLVDDLAHVNQLSATNRTRLSDIHVLLDHHIHVMTTLNIYDLDEMREDIKKLTGIESNHTIPLEVLANAHEVKLVDVEPDVILERLQQNERNSLSDTPDGLHDHLSQDTLSILRELTLRVVADDVNEKLESYRTFYGLPTNSSVTDRVLVAVQYNSNGTLLVRRGQQIANRLNAELDIITIVDGKQKLGQEERAFKEAITRLAEKIEANITEEYCKRHSSVADILQRYAQEKHITRIVIGQSHRSRFEDLTRGSLVNDLLTKAKQTDLMVISDRRSAGGERLLSYRHRNLSSVTYPKLGEQSFPQTMNHLKRGRFKIYIGAAPGVGKTYTMLREAHDLKARHIDVVGGIIETHHRQGTEEKIGDLTIIPQKKIHFRGGVFEEMDMSAILARNPEVILVDELAHSNMEGCTHRKRYEDVEELLSAGISVISTLNIQHIESLNDTVFELTGVKVRETVPDSILRMAQEVVLIDVPPETLQQRMREGKIYSIDKVEQALSHFFKQGNLIALREMALREVADHIDDRLEANDDRSALRGPWRRMEVIYVCVNTKSKAERLIRRGFRTAQRLKATMYVTFVQEQLMILAEDKARLTQLEELTNRLGGTFVRLQVQQPRDLVRLLAHDMEQKLVTQVFLGHSSRTKYEIIQRGYFLQNLLRSIRTMDVVVIADNDVDSR